MSESQPLSVGVVGCGRMGQLHARVYSQMPHVRLVGVYDADRDVAIATRDKFGGEVFDSIEALAKKLPGLNWENVVSTVNAFNAAVNDAPFDPSKHDGKYAHSISPVKSNWAQRLDTPPFYAFPVTCGITFTFGGVGITEKCEVKDTSGNVISGLFAAGEITGGSFFNNYPGGSGLMKGAVFGRLAGTHAAAFAKPKRA